MPSPITAQRTRDDAAAIRRARSEPDCDRGKHIRPGSWNRQPQLLSRNSVQLKNLAQELALLRAELGRMASARNSGAERTYALSEP